MRRHWAYFRYVCRHKWYVFWECLHLDVPLWVAILHDWDKFLSDEWIEYAYAFYTVDGKRQYKPSRWFDEAWNLHQKRNKHHWQFWLLTRDTGETVALKMPDLFVREMVADWRSASKVLGKASAWEWYRDNRAKIILHPDTRVAVEVLLLAYKT